MNAPNTLGKKGRKLDQVLLGARDIFLAQGFANANMDAIAKLAQVSKATVYSYFPDKQSLFIEVVKNECVQKTDFALEAINQNAHIESVLTQAAHHIIRFMLSDFSLRVFRICVAEADRFPELGQHFYQNGPQLGQQTLCTLFQAAIERGELTIKDKTLAADQFIELCKADLWSRSILGISTAFGDDEIDRVATGAVQTFMSRYAAPTS